MTDPVVIPLTGSLAMRGTSANTSPGAAMKHANHEQKASNQNIMGRKSLAGGQRRRRQRGGNPVVIVPTTQAGAAGAYGPGSDANAKTALGTSLKATAQSQYDALAPSPPYEFTSSSTQGGGTRKKKKKKKKKRRRQRGGNRTRRIYRWIKELGTCSRKRRGGRRRRRRAGSRKKRGRGRTYSRKGR